MKGSPQNSSKSLSFEISETLLLQKVAEGDWNAYADLFQHYMPKLSQYIFPFANGSREDTEEVIQEVFLKIWEKRDTLVTIRSFDHYLFRMAKNKLIDLIGKRKSIRNLHVKYIETRATEHSETEQGLLYSEYHNIAQKAIDDLSPKLKTVFLMSTQEDLTLDDICLKLDLPKETVKKRLYLATSFVKNYLRTNAELLTILLLYLGFH